MYKNTLTQKCHWMKGHDENEAGIDVLSKCFVVYVVSELAMKL